MLSHEKIGKNLKSIRTNYGISIETMSLETGISQSVIKGIESGNNSINLYTLNIICLFLGVEVIELMNNSISEEILIFRKTLSKIEDKIHKYDFANITADLRTLNEISKLGSISQLYEVDSILSFYYALDFFAKEEYSESIITLKSSLNRSSKSLRNLTTVIDKSRVDMLIAINLASKGDLSGAIKLELDLISQNKDPIVNSKIRLNLAKHYYSKKQYLKAYELTLGNIDMLKNNKLFSRLQGAYWMKGICEYMMNKEFSQSLKTAIHIAHSFNLTNQCKLFINSAKNDYGLNIQLP
ncbi:helix-turn-helix domain-containing protein [Microaceticoccus formicicus]|uniref:helix-turn-helix domain-containing protein n=1 Tax=Microaceticoccus formicicus TaxID=3118105 RepID=UPI003CD04C54|nr:helix-turn-helix transcriptional regulator [Peptoniphilaceae bacterium AMB_02]